MKYLFGGPKILSFVIFLLMNSNSYADIIKYKSIEKHIDYTTGTRYCLNVFKNTSCDIKHYFVCVVDNSSSYALGLGPMEEIQIASICESAWRCTPRPNPHTENSILASRLCKKNKDKSGVAMPKSCSEHSRTCVSEFLYGLKKSDQHRDQKMLDGYMRKLGMCFQELNCKDISAQRIIRATVPFQNSSGLANADIEALLPEIYKNLELD